ncbi:hypothetical protein OE88DRAFT_139937 [Heliocybe sulcata]|uniref:Uncharacterized protein n=1 Tax=Heliocybe sulcata TaxID=5364 RepID=A0A5C3NMT5_9AGAM|nr:hypothetical protein OE88DRAFT_139937 [Heliocybe sulcata]
MRVSFTPPSGQTTVLPVPEGVSEAQLLFRAVFESEEEVAHAKQEGVKVQVWSDIPCDGRAMGEWGALTLEELPGDDDSFAEGTISLAPRSPYHSQDAFRLKITAHLPQGQARFSYTYRLLYPSGEIKWLGEYGCNGSLVLERRDPRFSLRDGWRMESEAVRLWQNEKETSAEGVEVVELSKEFDWLCWSVGGEGRILSHALGDSPAQSSIVFLTPRITDNSVVCPSSLALCGPSGSSISISPTGIVNYSSPDPGALRMWTEAESCIEQVLSSLSGHSLRLALQDITSGHAFLASPAGAQPLSVSIIPFSQIPATSRVSLPIPTLGDLLPEGDRACYSIFSQASGVVRTRSITSEEFSEKGQITFVVDNNRGGQFTVAPVYALDDVQPEQAWAVAVVTAYSPVHAPPEPVHRLPTPPPSPPIQRVVKPAQPETRPSHVKRVSFNEPVSEVIKDGEEQPEEERRVAPSPAPLTVSRAYSQPPTHLLFRRYFGLIVHVGFWFLVRSALWIPFCFMRVFGLRLPMPGPRARADEEVKPESGVTEEPALAEEVKPDEPSASEVTEEPAVVEAGKPDDVDHESELSTAASPTDSEATIFSPQPLADHAIDLGDKAAEETVSGRLATLLTANLPAGQTMLLVRRGPATKDEQLRTELNGQVVELALEPVHEGEDSLFLATLDGGEMGGRLVVSVAIEN